MRRLIYVLICLPLLLASCGEKASVDANEYALLKSAVDATNASKLYQADFLLEVSVAEPEELVVFIQGSYNADKTGSFKMSGSMVQTVLSSPSSLYMAYDGGNYFINSGGLTSCVSIAESEFLAQFMCGEALCFDIEALTALDCTENGDSRLCRFSVDAAACEPLKKLIDTEVYEYAGVKLAQLDKTVYTDIKCDYTVNDGMLKSRTVTYAVDVYDTMPFYPNVDTNQEDYRTRLNVSLRVNYKAYGESAAFTMPEWANISGES